MCGICGVLRLDQQTVPSKIINAMRDTIAHRGPDGEGTWVSGPVGLGHRRLAIIDLSVAANQPMGNEDGSIVLVQNGEIYNYQELRIELESCGHLFHSHSDTETIIHAYEEWGEACLSRLNGMFAFALWDKRSRQLFLARDRFGVKPLYYYYDGSIFIFASEIKAILAHPQVSSDLCPEALNEYFTFQNILTDLTLFKGIRMLQPGHWLKLGLTPDRQRPEVHAYWDYPFDQPVSDLSLEDATEQLYHLFEQATTRQLARDVPIGSYLSGGMDSGSITAVARRRLGRLTTFTCGFDLSSASGLEIGFDERAQSESMANLFKTEHYEMVLHAGDMEHIMPELIWHQEDLRVGQCYPNYYVARLASKFTKVVLSGAGGDELFGGYPWRYYHGLNGANTGDYYRNYYDFWQRLVPDEEKSKLFNEAIYRDIGDHSTYDVFRNVFQAIDLPLSTDADCINASLYFELKTFLHGLLVVEDKVSMAHSLETRVPFLDNDLVDFAIKLPIQYKIRDLDNFSRIDENLVSKYHKGQQKSNNGKYILRRAMDRLIPSDVTNRPKQGFSAPDASWFRGESIDYINQLLRNKKARVNEILNPEYIHKMLDEHGSGQVNHRLFIWSVLSMEWWMRRFLN